MHSQPPKSPNSPCLSPLIRGVQGDFGNFVKVGVIGKCLLIFLIHYNCEIDRLCPNRDNQMNTRIAGYDFARSLAVFGLVVVTFSAGVEKSDYGQGYFIQGLLHSFMQGGAVATFLVLGGVGISLLTQRVRATNDAHGIANNRKRLIRRAASLLVIGICCNLIWHASFLCFYSTCIVIGALLLTVSNRWLWSLAFICVVISVVFIFLIYGYFNYFEVIQNWETFWDSNPWTVKGMTFRLYFRGFHTILSWTVFLLIGMWLGRQEVHYPRVRRDMLFGGIVVALVSVCALWMVAFDVPQLPDSFYPTSIFGWDMGNIWILVMSLRSFVMCGTATAIIGGSLMLTEKYPSTKWTKPFIASGQLALTLYVAHLIIGGGVQKLLEALDKTLPFAIGSAVIFCICAVVFSHFWRKRYDRGPLEWGIRRITGYCH